MPRRGGPGAGFQGSQYASEFYQETLNTNGFMCSMSRKGNYWDNTPSESFFHTLKTEVGVQPFGGKGLSGTGPKAGGPHTLLRFATERVVSTNTAAVGGNAALLSL